jgi:hypothetical protein
MSKREVIKHTPILFILKWPKLPFKTKISKKQMNWLITSIKKNANGLRQKQKAV